MLKPDARAYESCLAQLHLEASDCVFVDDQLRNVEVARRIGIRAVHFDVLQPARSVQEAAERLGVSLTV